jgi:hypothetical protein
MMPEANAHPVEETRTALKSVSTAMATAAEAVRDGTSDALARAKQALPAAGEYLSRFVYSSCYYLSYGVVFPTLLVTNSLPGGGPIADGLVDGATAANDVIVDMKEKSAARWAARTAGQPAAAHA